MARPRTHNRSPGSIRPGGGERCRVRAAAAAAEDGEAEVLDGGEGGHRVGVLVAVGGLQDLAHHELRLGDHGGQNLHVSRGRRHDV